MQRRRTISLSIFLLLPLTAFLFAATLLVFWLDNASGRLATTKVSDRLRLQTVGLVARSVNDFMLTPQRLVESNRRFIEQANLAKDQRETLATLFLTQIRAYRQMTYLSFGSAEGWYIGANRNPETGEILFASCDGPGQPFRTYRVGLNNRPGPLSAETPNYDPRKRSWYTNALSLPPGQAAAWYPIYLYVNYAKLGTGVSAPVRESTGTLLGVVAADIALNQLGDFLRGIPIGQNGQSAVLENDGKLVAGSFRNDPFTVDSSGIHRLDIADAGNPPLAKAWEHLGKLTNASHKTERQGSFTMTGIPGTYLVDWMKLNTVGGLDLVVLTVLPETDHFGDFDASTRQNLFLIILITMICAALVFLITRRILHPIRLLDRHAAAIASGENATLTLNSPIREIDGLFRAITDMTRDLAEANARLELSMGDQSTELTALRNQASLGAINAAGIAHEVRGPIGNGILAASRLKTLTEEMQANLAARNITQSALTRFLEECAESASIIQANLTRSADIAKGFQNVMVDQLGGSVREINVQEYLQQVLFSMKPLLRREGIKLHCDWGRAVFLTIDPGLLAHCLANLLNNAISHAFPLVPAGGKLVRITVRQEDDWVQLSFSDNGCGMNEATLAHIFDPLFTTRRTTDNSGLGLAIIRRLIEQKAGGTITASSVPGEGSTFLIRIPYRTALAEKYT